MYTQCKMNNITKNKKTVGEKISDLAIETGGYTQMNQDNKDMLEKVKTATTDTEVTSTLMKDPTTGVQLSYAESRMRFG
jgi:hypothetical protein